MKRMSAKVETKKKWRYFLMAMRYEAVPWGCGVWPALWMLSPDAEWPKGGEVDILEYANDIGSCVCVCGVVPMGSRSQRHSLSALVSQYIARL